MASWFVHQQRSDVIAVLHEPQPSLSHGLAWYDSHASRDNPGGHSFGVSVNSMEDALGSQCKTFLSLRDFIATGRIARKRVRGRKGG